MNGSRRISLRKVLPRSGPGNHANDKGENPCRDAETTQLKEYAMIQFVVEVSLRFDETCQSAPGASPNVEVSCPDCSKVGRIVECRLKQKEAYGLHPNTLKVPFKFFKICIVWF